MTDKMAASQKNVANLKLYTSVKNTRYNVL